MQAQSQPRDAAPDHPAIIIVGQRVAGLLRQLHMVTGACDVACALKHIGKIDMERGKKAQDGKARRIRALPDDAVRGIERTPIRDAVFGQSPSRDKSTL